MGPFSVLVSPFSVSLSCEIQRQFLHFLQLLQLLHPVLCVVETTHSGTCKPTPAQGAAYGQQHTQAGSYLNFDVQKYPTFFSLPFSFRLPSSANSLKPRNLVVVLLIALASS